LEETGFAEFSPTPSSVPKLSFLKRRWRKTATTSEI
jgi:hypothetical protein